MNRIAILIDGNNFYKGCQLNFNRTDVDFRKLGLKLCHEVGGELLRIYYYNAHVSKSIDPLGYQRQQKFFDNLRTTPYITLKLGHLVYHRIRTEQGISSQYFPTEKGIDVQIAVDMIRLGMLKSCEGIILVSGDSDYIYAVRFAKDLGTNVFIASFPMGGSSELRNEGDGAVIMDNDFLQDCFIRLTSARTFDEDVEVDEEGIVADKALTSDEISESEMATEDLTNSGDIEEDDNGKDDAILSDDSVSTPKRRGRPPKSAQSTNDDY